VGAAFDAGVLTELQDAGLEASSFFRANDTRTTGGDHGLVRTDGMPKPAWWTFWLWQQLASRQLRVSGTSEGLWAVASKDADRLTLFVASFSASQPTARVLDVDVTGLGWTPASATVRRIDAGHADASAAEALQLQGARVRVELPAQAVAMVELRREPAHVMQAVEEGGRSATLPSTGGPGPLAGLAVAGGAVAVRRATRKAVVPPR
jgi:hypothetical protein